MPKKAQKICEQLSVDVVVATPLTAAYEKRIAKLLEHAEII